MWLGQPGPGPPSLPADSPLLPCPAAAKREPPMPPQQAMAMASNLLQNLSFKPPKRVISLAEQPPLEEQIAGGCLVEYRCSGCISKHA